MRKRIVGSTILSLGSSAGGLSGRRARLRRRNGTLFCQTLSFGTGIRENMSLTSTATHFRRGSRLVRDVLAHSSDFSQVKAALARFREQETFEGRG